MLWRQLIFGSSEKVELKFDLKLDYKVDSNCLWVVGLWVFFFFLLLLILSPQMPIMNMYYYFIVGLKPIHLFFNISTVCYL